MMGTPLASFTIADAEEFAEKCQWVGLEIIDSGYHSDTKGWVKFQTRYSCNGQIETMTEHSEFEKENGRWIYVSGRLS